MWDSLFRLVDNILDDLQFSKQPHFFSFFIKQHAWDMSQLNHKNVLGDAWVDSCFQQNFEEFIEFAKFGDFSKLVLKVLPNVVACFTFGLLTSKQDLIAQVVIVLRWICCEISHLDTRYVAVFSLDVSKRENLENALALVVEHTRIISQLQVGFHRWCSGGVNVVQSSFWHFV